jgi:hypothetical protein
MLIVFCTFILSQAKDDISSYRSIESPFRMQKINLVWEKGRLHLNLTENKLSKLYSQLKVQDKEELTLKKLKSEGGDKAGHKETEVRHRFGQIMEQYGISNIKPSPEDNKIVNSKHLFKDKKLQKLWEKAEKSGMTPSELLALQEEFQHHQEKVDEYQRMLEIATNQNHVDTNEIQRHLDEEIYNIRDPNELKKRMKDLHKGLDKLHKLATNQGEFGFREPKVSGLWRVAMEADFSDQELESLRQELEHYEKRLEKLRFLQAELELVDDRQENYSDLDNEKTEGRRVMDRKLAKSRESVDKIHDHIETKIFIVIQLSLSFSSHRERFSLWIVKCFFIY